MHAVITYKHVCWNPCFDPQGRFGLSFLETLLFVTTFGQLNHINLQDNMAFHLPLKANLPW